MNKKTIILMSGLPAAGKSTYIEKYAKPQDIKVSRDTVREALRKRLHSNKYFPVSPYKEYEDWISTCASALTIAEGNSEEPTVWFDQTTLSNGSAEKFIRSLHRIHPINDWDIVIQIIDTPIEECIKRNNKRKGFEKVPLYIIEDMNRGYNLNKNTLLQKFKNDKDFEFLKKNLIFCHTKIF